jgi:hypothetical protein
MSPPASPPLVHLARGPPQTWPPHPLVPGWLPLQARCKPAAAAMGSLNSKCCRQRHVKGVCACVCLCFPVAKQSEQQLRQNKSFQGWLTSCPCKPAAAAMGSLNSKCCRQRHVKGVRPCWAVGMCASAGPQTGPAYCMRTLRLQNFNPWRQSARFWFLCLRWPTSGGGVQCVAKWSRPRSSGTPCKTPRAQVVHRQCSQTISTTASRGIVCGLAEQSSSSTLDAPVAANPTRGQDPGKTERQDSAKPSRLKNGCVMTREEASTEALLACVVWFSANPQNRMALTMHEQPRKPGGLDSGVGAPQFLRAASALFICLPWFKEQCCSVRSAVNPLLCLPLGRHTGCGACCSR